MHLISSDFGLNLFLTGVDIDENRLTRIFYQVNGVSLNRTFSLFKRENEWMVSFQDDAQINREITLPFALDRAEAEKQAVLVLLAKPTKTKAIVA